MINSITIEGRITKDIELKQFNDTKVLNNTIAVYGGKDANGNDITHFFDFKAFNYVAEQLSNQALKGSKIVLNGVLKQDKWTSDDKTMSKVVIYADSVVIAEKKELNETNVKDKVKETANKMKVSEEDLPY